MARPFYVLGIHDGHNCGATLTRDGAVVASISEERLTRNKNEVGYPKRSIEDVLRLGKIDAADLDEVVYASLFMHRADYLTELESWYCVGLDDQRKDQSQPKAYQKVIFDQRRRERVQTACGHLGIAESKVEFVEHHLAHLAAAYYSAPKPQDGRPILGLTCDGAGDGLCATVSLCQGNRLERLAATDRHASLGKIYSRTTMLMGMKPWEHEYKLMGMAPYADPERAERAAQSLRNLLKLSDNGLGFALSGELSTNYCYEFLRETFERVRFDTIAGAVQAFTEELLLDWVRACVRQTGVRDLVVGGGVFMNVKANMRIAALPEVDSFYVMPSGGDESLSIGACLHRTYQRNGITDHAASVFPNLYFGGDFTKADEAAAISAAIDPSSVTVNEIDDVDGAAVELLARGAIVARSRGRMEWGARALGNRSILVSGENLAVIERLNRSIKQRDFWMPFAPSIRAESAERYFADPKHLDPRFMTFAFLATAAARADLAAGIHPRDHTARVQLVDARSNPDYHRLLTLFERGTGRGGLVNTSFNLHGEPIVNSPADAIRVFLLSDLDHLALGWFLLSKRRKQTP